MKQLDIIINCPGDPHVGIPSSGWTIENIGPVEDDDRGEIRQAFADAFWLITDGGVRVIFSDELPPEYGDEK